MRCSPLTPVSHGLRNAEQHQDRLPGSLWRGQAYRGPPPCSRVRRQVRMQQPSWPTPAVFACALRLMAMPCTRPRSHSYKNGENINLSRVAEVAKHENDTGSSEYQVARLTARIEQLSKHLQANKKDFSAKRGLQAILSQRKSLLQYLYRKDRNRCLACR